MDCENCDGVGGWNGQDGEWVECATCGGKGYIEDAVVPTSEPMSPHG